MTILYSTNYEIYSAVETGVLLQESGDYLLQESGDNILLNLRTTLDQPLTHARLLTAAGWLAGGEAGGTGAETGYFRNGPLNTLTYEKWKPTGLPAQWTYTHTVGGTADCCCIAGHTLGTSGCSIAIQYWAASEEWISLITLTEITDDSPIFAMFPPTSVQKWRLYIDGTTAPEIAVIKFGTMLQMPRPIYGGHAPMDFARNTVMRMNESESGEYLGRSKWRSYLETTFSWSNLTAAWVRSNWKNTQKAIETEPFFIAWRPGSFAEVAFGRAMSVPVPSNSGTRDLMNVELNMRALSYD